MNTALTNDEEVENQTCSLISAGTFARDIRCQHIAIGGEERKGYLCTP